MNIKILMTFSAALVLAACGGNDDDATASNSSGTLQGLAATGAPIAGGAVTAKCVSGSDITGTTNTNGSFNLPLTTNHSTPCILRVVGGSPTITLHSFATAAGTVNISPLTELVVANALGGDPATAFTAFNASKSSDISAKLGTAKEYVKQQIAAVTGSSLATDPLSTPLVVGQGDDLILDALGRALTNTSKTLTDLRTAASTSSVLTNVVPAGNTGNGTGNNGFVARANPAGIKNTPSAIVWTGSEFVALEQSTDFHNTNAKFFVWKSADGSSWSRETTDLPSTFISLSTANGKLFQLTANLPFPPATPTVSIAQSSNGINWTNSSAGYVMGSSMASPMGVKHLNGLYFASLDVDTCMAISSADATTWTSTDLKTLALPTGYYTSGYKFCSEPFYLGSNYLIYGGVVTDDFRGGAGAKYKGLVYKSTDGVNWVIDTFNLPTGANVIGVGGRSSLIRQVGNLVLLPYVSAIANRRINPTDEFPTQVIDGNQVGTSTDGLNFTYADAVGITYRTATVGKPGLTSYFPSINVPGLGVLGMEGSANFWTEDGVNYTAATQGYGLTMTSTNYAYSPSLKRLVVIEKGSGLTNPTIMTKDF